MTLIECFTKWDSDFSKYYNTEIDFICTKEGPASDKPVFWKVDRKEVLENGSTEIFYLEKVENESEEYFNLLANENWEYNSRIIFTQEFAMQLPKYYKNTIKKTYDEYKAYATKSFWDINNLEKYNSIIDKLLESF